MNIQITVRLPDELVHQMDQLVKGGRSTSRASVVTQALEREFRRLGALEDAAVYAAHPQDDLEGLAEYARTLPQTELE